MSTAPTTNAAAPTPASPAKLPLWGLLALFVAAARRRAFPARRAAAPAR